MGSELRRRGVTLPAGPPAIQYGGERQQTPPPLSFREFVTTVKPRYQWYRHCVVLAAVLQRVADGELKRVMIFMPPRHGKSEETSRLFSAYLVYRFPERYVGICSYSADLAFTLSRAARENYIASGGTLSTTASAVQQWETGQGGGLWAAGVGGPITGKGFHCGIIDDPVKNADEARSETIKANIQEWYQSTFLTREEPDAAIIVIQTRWNEMDLAGWLLLEESGEDQDDPDDPEAVPFELAERWHIVNFAALKDEVEPTWPASCTVEPDWRTPGQALCPERYDERKLKRRKKRLGAYFFAALYQQQPMSPAGGLFKLEHFRYYTNLPTGCKFIRYWDNAAVADGGDWTVGLLMAVDKEGNFYVVDIVRGQWDPEERERTKRSSAILDRAQYGYVKIWFEVEGGSSGKDSAVAQVKNLVGFDVEGESPTGKKEVRAEPVAAQVKAHNVFFLETAAWLPAFIKELIAFGPGCAHDDQVDTLSGAFNRLSAPFDPKTLLLALHAKARGWGGG